MVASVYVDPAACWATIRGLCELPGVCMSERAVRGRAGSAGVARGRPGPSGACIVTYYIPQPACTPSPYGGYSCRYLSLAAGGGARLLGVPEATRAARARAAAALALW